MTGTKRPPRLRIRIDDRQTWILSDRTTGSDVGGVSYHHSRHGNHYQPWLLEDGRRISLGAPLPQLGQAARAIEDKVLSRPGFTEKSD